MRVCIYAGASNKIEQKYILFVEKLGENLAEKGCSLVYGGGGSGLMGAAARGFRKGGAEVIGVIPTFMDKFEPVFEDCTEIIRTADMSERKNVMEEKADMFMIVPGGIGTFDELFQILTLKELERHDKRIVIYNIDGYYTKLLECLEDFVKKGFVRESIHKYFEVVNVNTLM